MHKFRVMLSTATILKLPVILCLYQDTVSFVKPAVYVELNRKVMENLWTKNGWQETITPNLHCSLGFHLCGLLHNIVFVVCCQSFRTTYWSCLQVSFFLDCLALKDGSGTLSWNIGNKPPTYSVQDLSCAQF